MPNIIMVGYGRWIGETAESALFERIKEIMIQHGYAEKAIITLFNGPHVITAVCSHTEEGRTPEQAPYIIVRDSKDPDGIAIMLDEELGGKYDIEFENIGFIPKKK